MEQIRAYLLSITAAAILCGIVRRLLGNKGTPAVVGKMLCGVFLALAVMQPFIHFQPGLWEDFSFDIEQAAAQAVRDGQAESKKAMAKIIKEKCEAYILEKAGQMQTELTVEVFLSDDDIPVPNGVHLHGAVSPNTKSRLQTMIADGLGLSKEKQIWT